MRTGGITTGGVFRLNRRTVLSLILTGLGSLDGSRASLAGRLAGASPHSARGGVYRNMTWCPVRGIAATFRMPAGGWPDECAEPSGLLEGPVAEVSLHYWTPSGWAPHTFPARFRVVVVSEELRGPAWPGADLVIAAPERDMEAVGEAFLRVLDDDCCNGASLASLDRAMGIHLRRGAQPAARVAWSGRAVVLDGVARPGRPSLARDALASLRDEGFGELLCLTALVSRTDTPSFPDDEFYEFMFEAVKELPLRSLLVATAHEASRSALVLAGLQPPA